MIDCSQFDSLISMTMYFNNEDVCKQTIIETRWGVGDNKDVVCPYCGEHLGILWSVKDLPISNNFYHFNNTVWLDIPMID